jgi:hypothetical protein
VQRSLGIFFLGLLLGGFLGYVLHRPGRAGAGSEDAPWQSARNGAATNQTARSSIERKTEDQKILLGDIASIPFQELYEILSRQRPEEIGRLAQQLDHLPPGQPAQAKIRAFFTAWAHLDPAAAFDSAIDFHNPGGRSIAVGAIIAGADANAIGAIAKAITELASDTLPGSSKNGLFNQAIEKWSEADPAAAARLLSESRVDAMQLMPAFYTVASNWAASDPAAALAWAQEQRAVPFDLNPVSGAVIGWWKKAPADAEAYALSQIGTPLGKQLISNLASQMADGDRAKATTWIGNLPDGELRNQAYGIMATQLAFNDPKTASAWALDLPPNARNGAVESSVSIWARTDPTAAGRWIEGLTGSTRDSAVSSYSYTVVENDPATAMAWAVTISDETKRDRVTQRAMREWLERDPSAAQTWIQNSSLGEAEKARLLATPTPSP